MGRRVESRALASFAACAGALLATVGVEPDALADDEAPKTGPVYVVWIAPLECPRQPEVSAEIDRFLGAQPRRSREGVEVRARVSQRSGGDPATAWHADIDLVSAGETETRAVDGDSCAALAHAVAVIAAVASDASSATPVRARSFFAAGSAAVDVGTLPRPAFGVDLGFGWHMRSLELGIDGALYAQQHASSARAGAGADFLLARARARACTFATLRWATLGPCATIGLDAMSAHGTGSDRPSDVTSTSLTLGADVVARAQLTPAFAVRAVGGLAVPLGRPTFVVVGGGALHRAAVIAIPLVFGAEIDF